MSRGDPLIRQWKIMRILATSKSGRTVAELAEELGCRQRTVYRDLAVLQHAGFPLYSKRVEGRSRWSLLGPVLLEGAASVNLRD